MLHETNAKKNNNKGKMKNGWTSEINNCFCFSFRIWGRFGNWILENSWWIDKISMDDVSFALNLIPNGFKRVFQYK